MRLPITPATTLLRELRDEARHHYRSGRVVIAVDGIDGAGKTVFADALADVFAEDGSAVFRASIDDFHRPRTERYAARAPLARGLLPRLVRLRDLPPGADRPVPRGRADRREPRGSSSRRSTSCATPRSSRRGRPRRRMPSSSSTGSSCTAPSCGACGTGRCGSTCRSTSPTSASHCATARIRARRRPSNARYRDGQELYLKEAQPRAEASAIVDNTDLAHPHRVFQDYC